MERFFYFQCMEEITITREELHEKVWSTPLTKLAKEFKISDVGLRKKCLKHNIPLPKVGFWSKVQHGKKVKRTPLPMDPDSKPITFYVRNDNEASNYPSISERNKLKHEIASQYQKFLIPTVKLSKPHRLVQEVRKNLSETEADYEGYVRSDSSKFLTIAVSKQKISLALKVFNSFIQLGEARGHMLTIKNRDTIITIDGIEIKVDVRERYKRVVDESQPSDYPYHKNIPTGILVFRKKDFEKNEWDDSKRPIESQFPSVFANLETSAAEKKRWEIEWEKRRVQQEKERKIRLEQYQSKLTEFKKVEKLIEDSDRWNKAEIIRRYADHLEAMGKAKEEVEWAKVKADWIDPTTGKQDMILGEYSPEPPKNPNYW